MSRFPRNVLHADVLARIAGRHMIGGSFERTLALQGGVSLVFGLARAQAVSMDASGGADVPKITSDLIGVGGQFRHYIGAPRGPRGFYGAVALSLVGGDGSGRDDMGRRRTYRYLGYEVSLLGLGYQLLVFDRLCIDASATFRQSLGLLREQGGGDHGVSAWYGIVVAGGVGLAF